MAEPAGARVIVEVANLNPGEMRRVERDGVQILLCNVGGDYFAVEDRCSHAETPLSEGCLTGYRVECALHGAVFDVRDGSACELPAFHPIASYPVRRRNGALEIEIR